MGTAAHQFGERMTSRQRFWVGCGILLLYLVLASGLVWLSYRLSPPTTPDQWKEFGVRAGIALTAVGAFVGIIVALFTLNAQINAARRLEEKKGEIVAAVEDLKGRITRQNEFLKRTLDAKTQAYNDLFKASAVCYSELQYLARGEFDKKEVRASERALITARGLEANLDDADREIIGRIVQSVYNIIDLAWDVEDTDSEKKAKYEKLWNENNEVKNLGAAIKELRDRSPFYNQKTTID